MGASTDERHIMLYIDTNTLEVIDSDQAKDRRYVDTMTRHDLPTYEYAAEIAAKVTAVMGNLHLAIDNGSNVYPRYDIIKAPAVGDEVSYSFNGDTYPDGKISKISESMRVITTDTGNVYYRRKLTGAWKRHNTWTLVPGHRFEQNPHF